jgi:cysteinyl-tRNA synthetase
VNYWLHNEFIVMSAGKMAKSKGGFLTLQTLVDAGYEPLDYRYFLLGAHYRSQQTFSYEALDSARSSRRSLMDRIFALRDAAGLAAGAAPAAALGPGAALGAKAEARVEAFIEAMCQDLATPRALAELWGVLRDADVPPAEALAAAYRMDEILGLRLRETEKPAAAAVDPAFAAEIDRLVAERTEAKKAKDWKRADAIRDELKAKGVVLEDGPSGTAWRRG